MTKIEEIAFKYTKSDYYNQQTFSFLDVISAMKEYAEYYAEKCLEVAAENATGTPMYDYSNPYTTILLEDRVNINFDSILNIKLPDHE